jgi:chorismate mutase
VNIAASTRKASYVDIVWNEREEAVLEEIRAILEKPDPTPKEIFLLRTRAASRVYRRLTRDEKAVITRKADTAEKNKNPPRIQQR